MGRKMERMVKISIPCSAYRPLDPGQGQGAELAPLHSENMTDLFFTYE